MNQLQEEKDDIKEKKRDLLQQMSNNIQAKSQQNLNIIETQPLNEDKQFTPHTQNHQDNQDNKKQSIASQQALQNKQLLVKQTTNEEKKVQVNNDLDKKVDEDKQQQRNQNDGQQEQEQQFQKQQQQLSEVKKQQQKEEELIDNHENVNIKEQEDKLQKDQEIHNSSYKQENKKENRQQVSQQQHHQNQQQSFIENQQLIENNPHDQQLQEFINNPHDRQQQQNFLRDNEHEAKQLDQQEESNQELLSIHTNNQQQLLNIYQNNQQQSQQINSNSQTPNPSQSQSINPPNNYNHTKPTIQKYLIIAYYTYVIDHYSTSNTIFDKQQIFKKPLIDLTLFLKFYKDFNLKSILKVNEIIKVFKKTAINHLWLDVDLLINLIISITDNKIDQQKGTIIKVNDQSLINQRSQKLLALFDKQKVKKHLKGHNKQLWQQILKLYNQRNMTNISVEKSYQNKQKVVGKFLQRNFDQQVPKWLQKKQKQLPLITNANTDSRLIKKDATNKQSHIKQIKLKQSDIKQIKHSSTPNDNDIGDQQQSISNRIQKLRSKSQKSITNLKKLIKINDQTINYEINKLISRKSFISKNHTVPNQNQSIHRYNLKKEKHTQQEKVSVPNPNSKRKKQPLHKNKHKNTQSVQKQIQNFLNQENSKLLKSQKHLFLNQLKIIDQEPFLNQYFSSEINLKNSLINIKSNLDRKGNIQKSNKNLIQDKRDISNKKSLDLLPKIKAKINPSEYFQRKIDNKFSKDNKDRKQQILSLNSYKGKIVRSQPSYYQQQKSLLGLNEDQRRPKARSMKKDLIQNDKGQESIQLKRINKILSQKMDDGSMKMSEKKLYEYLAKNKQSVGMNSKNVVNLVNKDIISSKGSISIKQSGIKINPNLVGSNSPSMKKNLQQQVSKKRIKKQTKQQKPNLSQQKRLKKQKPNPSSIKNLSPSTNLINNYRQQVYELYKNVKNSYHHSPEDKEIILKQKLKRKGYVKELNNPQYLK